MARKPVKTKTDAEVRCEVEQRIKDDATILVEQFYSKVAPAMIADKATPGATKVALIKEAAAVARNGVTLPEAREAQVVTISINIGKPEPIVLQAVRDVAPKAIEHKEGGE